MTVDNSPSNPIQTVIIPTWNQKHMLLEAIDSCLKQRGVSLEVIVFDDGSTDGTDELMKTVTDERVHYFRSDKNVGGGRKYGLDHARGKYITFLDHDDYYTDYEFFAKAIAIHEQHKNDPTPLAYVCANALRWNILTNKQLTSDIGTPGRANGIDFIIGMTTGKYDKPPSVFPTVLRADILRQIDFDKYAMGDIHIYNLAALLGDVWLMPDVIGVNRKHANNESDGVKNNPEYDKRIPRGRVKSMKTWTFVRDTLYQRTDKKSVDKWYLSRMKLITSLSTVTSRSFKNSLKVYYVMIKETGFMPSLWVRIPCWFVYYKLRSIKPVVKVYLFIKHLLTGKPYPKD